MAEDDTPNRVEDDEDAAPRVVSFHDPLPPPPEVHYTRPSSGQSAPAPTPTFSLGGSSRDVKEDDTSRTSVTLKLGSGLAAGTTFMASIVAGFLLGQWIDHRWNHGGGLPWGTLICSLVGVTAGFLNLFRVLSATDRNRSKR